MNTKYIEEYANTANAKIILEGLLSSNDPVDFLAFLTSFSDSMTSNWNEENVYGRPDPIGTFQNTSRKISLGFDLPAASLIEAEKNLTKINKVKQFMYPAYSTNNKEVEDTIITTNALSLAKSPLIRLSLANLIHNGDGVTGLLGWINSFSANPVIEMGMFTSGNKLYPKVYNVTLDFTPQHEFDLGTFAPDNTPLSNEFSKFPYDGGS